MLSLFYAEVSISGFTKLLSRWVLGLGGVAAMENVYLLLVLILAIQNTVYKEFNRFIAEVDQ